MLRILLIAVRQERLQSFVEGLALDPEVRLDWAATGEEAVNIVQAECPDLAIVDSASSGCDPFDLVRRMIGADAMVNTAVISPLSEADFHERSEGLGVLCRLPPDPDGSDSKALLQKLRSLLGIAQPGRKNSG